MNDETRDPTLYPSHDWGPLASDPFMTLDREDRETRAALKRMWMRSGGGEALFDTLIPIDGPYGPLPRNADPGGGPAPT